MPLRPIAIYLPQFHPIPENNEWWGKGFTEWTNVTKAKPLFNGHYQPHLPADLGFYDLRLDEARQAQADLAREYGIHGFCYYHYWFNGRRILERPFQEVFESGEPDFPFMLCWANENWTRTWDGKEKNVLLKQDYSFEDDRNHIKALIPYFKDERYIRIDNKPVFAIYRSTLLPEPKRTLEIWREEASREGLELYICRFETFGTQGEHYLEEAGFDAAIDFQPGGNFSKSFQPHIQKKLQNRSILTKVKDKTINRFNIKETAVQQNGYLLDYNEYVDFILTQDFPSYNWMPCVNPMWDNSARRQKGYGMLVNATPDKYAEWLGYAIQKHNRKSEEENLLFINAWNEWAEGNHLEPCQKWGLQYLEKTKEVLDRLNNQ
jgi:lipopolysaccharide biosynthesis protein